MNILIDWLLRADILILAAVAGESWRRYGKNKQPKFLWLFLAALLLAATGADAIFIEPNVLLVKEHRIALNKFKEPLKIALISDIHAGPYVSRKFVRKTVDKIIAQKPDVALIAGDYLFEDEFEKYIDFLDPLAELAAKMPVYAVLGNHEYGLAYNTHAFVYDQDQHENIAEKLRSLGIRVLVNEAVEAKIKNQKVRLIGAQELWLVSSKSLKRLLAIISEPSDSAKIVLAHNPDLIYELPYDKIDLFLAGHTHGGQIRLPFIGALGDAQTRLPKKFYQGLSEWGDAKMFVTSGLGESGFGVRFWNPPRIDILEIR